MPYPFELDFKSIFIVSTESLSKTEGNIINTGVGAGWVLRAKAFSLLRQNGSRFQRATLPDYYSDVQMLRFIRQLLR